MTTTPVFDRQHSNNPVNLIRETMEIVRTADGRLAAAFSTWTQKGVANHEIPIEEYGDFVAALDDMAENPPEPEEEAVTMADRLRRTYKIVVPEDKEGIPTGEAPYAQYKLTTGRGTKSCRVALDSLPDVVRLLSNAEEGVKAAAERFEAIEEAERIRKAEKEANAEPKATEAPVEELDAGSEE
jgi:hypothetical protein